MRHKADYEVNKYQVRVLENGQSARKESEKIKVPFSCCTCASTVLCLSVREREREGEARERQGGGGGGGGGLHLHVCNVFLLLFLPINSSIITLHLHCIHFTFPEYKLISFIYCMSWDQTNAVFQGHGFVCTSMFDFVCF